MIINRIATALKQRDWSLVIIELVLVFAGVFIALQFDNWNTHQRNQKALTEMLQRVSAELDLNLELIGQTRELIGSGRDNRLRAERALAACEDSPEARTAINQTMTFLTRDFSPSLSNETLPQLNRRDPYLDLLSSEFRWALSVYSNQVQEEQRQLQFNAGLRWDQHVMKHPSVAADFSDPSIGLQISPSVSITELCQDPTFTRRFYVTSIFLESTLLRLQRFNDRLGEFRSVLEAEIAKRS